MTTLSPCNLQLLRNLVPVPVLEVLLVADPSLLDVVGPRVNVRAVPHQLSEPLEVGREHALRVRQDLGHMHRNTHLESGVGITTMFTGQEITAR